jgi:hypothetical protein
MKEIILAIVLIASGSTAAYAGNDALAQASPAPLGERVANYLQTMMTVKTAIWEQNHPADMDYREEIHLAVSYEPSEELIGVSVIGSQNDPRYVQALLAKIQKTMLSFGKKIKNDYGAGLTEGDFSLAYLNVKTGKIILRLKEGKVVEGEPAKTP